MPISYNRVIEYLSAIAAKGSRDVEDSPHGNFWANLSYEDFIALSVPGVTCQGNPIPLIDRSDLPTSAANSPLYLILTNSYCSKGKMPLDGPFITDADYQVTLRDGTSVSGAQIQQDLLDWLNAGFPE